MVLRAVLSLAIILAVSACEEPVTPLSATYEGLPAPQQEIPREPVSMIEAGNRLLNAGEPELALKAFASALADERVSVDALIGLGYANHKLGRLNQARKMFEIVIELEPEQIMAWNNLGVVRYLMGDIPAATRAFRTAFALSGGKSDSIRHNLALAQDQASPSFDPESIVPEFRLIRSGYGRYQLTSYKADEDQASD